MEPDWWDPLSGRIDPAEVVERSAEATTVALDLEPYGSRVLAFSHRAPSPKSTSPKVVTPAPLDLSRDWIVSFGQDEESAEWKILRSWTDAGSTRHFSGVATYRKHVAPPDGMLDPNLRVELDLGDVKAIAHPMGRMQALVEAPVREAAIVYVNGLRAGSVWCPPYRVDVTGLLTRGDNKIRIEVANLALNHMAGRPLPDYSELKARYGDRFQPQDMGQVAPVTAGLLGPIRLVAKPRH
jgi:hypothetical protein